MIGFFRSYAMQKNKKHVVYNKFIIIIISIINIISIILSIINISILLSYLSYLLLCIYYHISIIYYYDLYYLLLFNFHFAIYHFLCMYVVSAETSYFVPISQYIDQKLFSCINLFNYLLIVCTFGYSFNTQFMIIYYKQVYLILLSNYSFFNTSITPEYYY